MNKKISTGVGIATVVILGVSLILPSFTQAAKKSSWKKVGKLGFSAGRANFVDFAFNPVSHRPYVAFSDQKKSEKATVMQLVGSKWKNVGSAAFSPNGIQDIALAFDASSTPYVAFETSGSGKITVMKFNGSAWENVGQSEFVSALSLSLNLVFNPVTNVPYVAFTWPDNGNEARVMKFNGNEWEIIGSTNFSSYDEYHPSLAFDANGTPYLACTEHEFSDKVTVLKYSGLASDIHSTWDVVGSEGISSASAEYISLAINPSTNQPYVAYSDEGNGYKLTVKKFNGTSWENAGSDGFTSRQADYVSLAFNPLTFEPYVTFQSGTGSSRSYEGRVMKFNGSAWANVGKSFGKGYFTKIAFKPGTRTPYVAFSDLGRKEKVSVKKYSK